MADSSDIVKFVASFEVKGIEGVRAHVEDLRKSTEQARQRTAELSAAMKSGEWASRAKEAEGYRRQLKQLEDQQKRLTLAARYGRVGGAAAHYGGLIANSAALRATTRAVGGAAVAGAATVTGLARSGFSNTVEMNRFNLELQLASRELAGAFVPALRAATGIVGGIRRRLERLSPKEQNALAGGTLAVGGIVGASLLSRAVLGVGLGGAALGAGRGLLAAGRGLAFLGGAAPAAGIGAGGAAAAGLGAGAAARRFGGRALNAAKVLGPALAVGQGLTGGYIDDLEAKGNNWLIRNLGGLGGGALDALTFGEFTKYHRAKGRFQTGLFADKPPGNAAAAGPNKDRNRVTIADAGFEAPGSAFERIATKLALVDALKPGEEPEKDPLTQIKDIISDIWDVVKAKLGVTELK